MSVWTKIGDFMFGKPVLGETNGTHTITRKQWEEEKKEQDWRKKMLEDQAEVYLG